VFPAWRGPERKGGAKGREQEAAGAARAPSQSPLLGSATRNFTLGAVAAAVGSGVELPQNRCPGCGKGAGGIRKEAERRCWGRMRPMGTASAAESRSHVVGWVRSPALASSTLGASVLALPESGPGQRTWCWMQNPAWQLPRRSSCEKKAPSAEHGFPCGWPCTRTGWGACWGAALWRGTGSAGGRQGDQEPAACPGCPEGRWDPGVHPEECGQQGEGGSPSPLPWGGPICSAGSSAGLPGARKMRSYWRESSAGLRG